MIREQFFPTTVIMAKDVQLDNQQLAQDIVTGLIKIRVYRKQICNGWHSKTDMHLKPEYQQLVQELYEMQKKYI
jgi:hypothetical protein